MVLIRKLLIAQLSRNLIDLMQASNIRENIQHSTHFFSPLIFTKYIELKEEQEVSSHKPTNFKNINFRIEELSPNFLILIMKISARIPHFIQIELGDKTWALMSNTQLRHKYKIKPKPYFSIPYWWGKLFIWSNSIGININIIFSCNER